MGALDLNRIAVTMGKVMKMIEKIEASINGENDLEEKIDDFCFLAYVCRIGILDRIEANSYMSKNLYCPIRIPIGFIKSRKETISSGIDLTIGKLFQIAQNSPIIVAHITNILEKGELFHNYDSMLNSEEKRQLLK